MDIRIRNIRKSFGDKIVIENLSMDIASGSFTTLLGPSGCGKTTLLRMIAGLEIPDSGEIYLGNRCVFSSERNIVIPPEERGIGFVFQDFALWPHMRVKDNVAFGLRAKKMTENLDEKVKAALHAVQLDDFAERFPAELSGGPLSALDALLREEMRSELKALVSERGITSVFVTHDQTEAMLMSDMIAVMNKGSIEQYGRPEEIYSRPKTAFAARFVGSSDWIDETHMFRPESVSIGEGSGRIEYRAKVIGSEFMGSFYRLLLSHDGNKWVISADRPYAVGSDLTVNIKNDSIVKIGKEG